MSKFSVWTVACAWFTMVHQALCVELPPPSEFEDFSGAMRRSHDRVTLGNPVYVLTGPTVIKADEVIINGTIVTRGHQLLIDTRRLEFKAGATIKAYSLPMARNHLMPAVGVQGSTGCDSCRNVSSERTHDGEKGGVGGTGATGYTGPSAKASPSPILVFAAEVIGTPTIDGTGQKGGQGGTGGKGGTGGAGGRGEKAWVGLVWSWEAGHGGDSGQRGQGGQGGPGGKGGGSVPIVFLTSKKTVSELQLNFVKSSPGLGGAGGEGGPVGDEGRPGQGGDGDSCWRVLGTKKLGPGACGQVDSSTPSPSSLGVGPSGTPGPSVPGNYEYYQNFLDAGFELTRGSVVRDFYELEQMRTDVARSWFQFHWSRILRLLVSESITHLFSRKDSDDIFTGELQFLAEEINPILLARGAALIEAWDRHLVRPLTEQENVPGAVVSRDQLLQVAEPLLEAMREINHAHPDLTLIKKQLEDSLFEVDSFFKSSLHQSLQKCLKYNKATEGLKDQIINFTSHFEIPVCLGNPDLRDPKNIKAKYDIFPSYNSTVPDHVRSEVISPDLVAPNPERVALDRTHSSRFFHIFGWFDKIFGDLIAIQSAYANFDILFLNQKTVEIEKVRKLIPNSALVSPASVITGFKMITPEDAIQRLSLHLSVLTSLAGN